MSRWRRSVVWSAIGHRRGQAAVLVLLSTLLTASAALGPLYARALEHGLLLDALSRASVVATGVVIEQKGDRTSLPDPSVADRALTDDVRQVLAPGTVITSGQVEYAMSRAAGGAVVVATGYAPARGCVGLVITAGRCVQGAEEVMVSTAQAAFEGRRVGDSIAVTAVSDGVAAPSTGGTRLKLVGTFDQQPDEDYWFGVPLVGRAGTVSGGGLALKPLVDPPVLAPAFFDRQPFNATVTTTHALRRDAVGVDALPGILDSLRSSEERTQVEIDDPRVTSSLDEIGATVVAGQRQAALLVPLLLGQLALLAVVVLGLAMSAAVEQRRPEIALSRLRGAGVGGARRALLAELATFVVLGVPLGLLTAVPLTVVVSRIWLPAGVPVDVPWTVYAAAGVALLGGLGALLLTSAAALREPIPSLLRRIPPRQRGLAVGLLDAVVITVALAGVVTITTGNASGPLAMATPALLALGAGLLVALLVVPLTAWLGRRALGRGRVTAGLTAVHLARRPAVRRVVAIVTVASALLVFATDAFLAADRNREARATLEAGSAVVLRTDSTNPAGLRQLVSQADPSSSFAAPVALVQRPDASARSTMAVVPAAMSVLAAATTTPVDWASLAAPVPPRINLLGRWLTLVVDQVSVPTIVQARFEPDVDGNYPVGEPPVPGARPDDVPLKLGLLDGAGLPTTIALGRMSLHPKGPQTLSADIFCLRACSLASFVVDRDLGEDRLIAGSLRIRDVRVDGQVVAGLGSANWTGLGTPVPPREATAQTGDFGTARAAGSSAVAITFASASGTVALENRQPPLPAIIVPPPGQHDDASGASSTGAAGAIGAIGGFLGTDVPAKQVGTVPVAPGDHTNVAIVDYDALAGTATQLYTRGSLEVWVSDPSRVESVRTALASGGVTVVSQSSRAEILAGFDASASAWSLRLAILIGIVALVLSALVLTLVTVTSWRTRSSDYAALRLAGVRLETVRRVGVLEQVGVIGLAVAVGAVCGYVGSRLALGLIPLFTVPSATFTPDLRPAVGPMVVTAVVTGAWLCIVAALLGRWLVSRADVERVRSQA